MCSFSDLRWTVMFALSVATSTSFGASLADAVKRQDMTTARAMLIAGTDVNLRQADGMTALHWAIYHDHDDVTKLLVLAGADVQAKNRYGVMPLSLACTNGNAGIVKLLLEAGANPNASLFGGETVLMTAARTGNKDTVQALIAAGAEIEATEHNGQTALMWAAAEGNLEAVNILIRNGADFESTLASGFTPLFFAIRQGHTDVVFRLLQAGVEIDAPMQPRKRSRNGPPAGMTSLLLAVENGHFELAAALLDAGASANDNQCGYTALHAITWVRKPIRGDGDPPPIGSGNLNSLQLVRKLVAKGADVDARYGEHRSGGDRLNRTDATPFLLASEAADISLMRLLLELGADPSLQNADSCTPLLAAAGVGVLGDGDESAGTEAEAIEAVRLILSTGADIDAIDDRGNSAMHGAAYKSWPKLVLCLADNGADIKVWNQKNRRGWTPMMIARGNRPGNFRPSQPTIVALEQISQVTTDGP
jgi:ankyrin repeat protein